MGLHWYDMLALVVLGLIIFGPKRLPEMGSSLGKTIREFQKSMREVTNPEPHASVSPSAEQSLASTPAPATAIESAAPATTEATEAEGATPLVEEDAVH